MKKIFILSVFLLFLSGCSNNKLNIPVFNEFQENIASKQLDPENIKSFDVSASLYQKNCIEVEEQYCQFAKIKDQNISFGYFESNLNLVFVDKINQKLTLYEIKNKSINTIMEYPIITGLMGDKQKEGDLKTPIGVYEFSTSFTPQDPYLGILGFWLSYPNSYDKHRSKTGSGIWIHGFPLDGDRETNQTKGCIAINNDLLLDFDSKLSQKRRIAIIFEDFEIESSKMDIALILSQLYKWKNAQINQDFKTYIDFYDTSFTHSSGRNFNSYKTLQEKNFVSKKIKDIQISKIIVLPYPNESDDKVFRITFTLNYIENKKTFSKNKTLYVKMNNKKIFILNEI